MNDPEVFYNQEDEWNIAKELYEAEEQQIESTYLIMKLPDEEKEEFVLTLTYTPRDKKNLTALLVGRNDNENYGELVVYKMPKGRNIYGPMQIENKIDADDNISREFTLWSQRGSRITRGNLLTIPIADSLLYVEPIYLRADSENSLPEVRRVIVGYGETIVMEDTFEEALDKIFGGDIEEPGEDRYQPEPGATDDENTQGLIGRAQDVFNRAQEAQKAGNWAEYGRLIDELNDVIERLSRLNNVDIDEDPDIEEGLDIDPDPDIEPVPDLEQDPNL